MHLMSPRNRQETHNFSDLGRDFFVRIQAIEASDDHGEAFGHALVKKFALSCGQTLIEWDSLGA